MLSKQNSPRSPRHGSVGGGGGVAAASGGFWALDASSVAALADAAVAASATATAVALDSTPFSLAAATPAPSKQLPHVVVLEFAPPSPGGAARGGAAGGAPPAPSPRAPQAAGEAVLVPFDMRGPSPREQVLRAKALAEVEEGAVMRAAELLPGALRARGWGADCGGSVEAAVAAGSAEAAFALLTQKDLKLAAAFEAALGEQVSVALQHLRRGRNAAARGAGASPLASSRSGGGGGSPRGFSGQEAFAAEGGGGAAAPAARGEEEMEVLRGLDVSAVLDKFVARLYFGLSRALMRSTAAQRSSPPRARSPPGGAAAAPAAAAAAASPARSPLAFSPFAGAVAAEASLPAPPPPLSTARVVAAPPLLLGQRLMRLACVAHLRGTMAPPLQFEDDTALQMAKALQGAAFREPQPTPLVLAAATAQRLISSFGVMPRAAALLQFAAALRCRYEEVGGALAGAPGAKPLAALGLPAAELAELEGAGPAIWEEAEEAERAAAKELTAEEKAAEERELELADKLDVDELLASSQDVRRARAAALAAKKERLHREFDFDGAKAEAKRFVKELVEKRKHDAERRA